MTAGIPLSIGQLLFGRSEGDAAAEAITDALRQHGTGRRVAHAIGGLGGAARQALSQEIGRTAQSLLDLDLSDVLAKGWRKHAELHAAGERTAADPSATEVVELAEHTVTWEQAPEVDVFVEDVLVTRVQLEVKVQFELRGAVAVVQRGRLTEVRSGAGTVSASLTCEDVPVATRSTTFDAVVQMRLDGGVALVGQVTDRAATGG